MIKKVSYMPAEDCLKEAARCIGCGTCMTACPVYADQKREALTARGRNARLHELIQKTKQSGLAKDLEKCLLCGRCTMVCPQGIHNDRIVAMLRAIAVEHHGLPISKRFAIRDVLSNRKRMGKMLRWATRLQKILPAAKNVTLGNVGRETLPPVRHLPLFFTKLAGGRHLPSISDRFLSEILSDTIPAAGPSEKKVRVAFFAGCAMEFVLPNAAVALVELLSKLGMEVVFPKDQGCCGLALHANGDRESARAMALKNAEVLEACNADMIITGCATCGSALRDMWPQLGRTPKETNRFKAIAAKTQDFSEVALSKSFPEPFPYVSTLPEGAQVTWHEPCHLGRHQHVSREPRNLLRRMFGPWFVELKSRCCGFGGSFNFNHYNMSKDIASNKANDLREVDADFVITSCPGCAMQLVDTIAQNNLNGHVIHLAEAMTIK